MGVEIVPATSADLPAIMSVMTDAFDPAFGEAWTLPQCAGMMSMPGSALVLARRDGHLAGFALSRTVVGEAELLLLGVRTRDRRAGIGRALLDHVVAEAKRQDACAIHLEVRAENPAIRLYVSNGFDKIGTRHRYYRGNDGRFYDAETYSLSLARNIA